MDVSHQDLLSSLRHHFGYESFLPGQEEAIRQIMSGGHAVVLAPTGNGKSLCYQLPAVLLQGVTLVVSPLIALMKDQVDALRARGIAADTLNSQLTVQERNRVLHRLQNGITKLLYISPERVATDFIHSLRSLDVALIAVDEAHCVSEWGHEFRPEYRQLSNLREACANSPVIALTATATERTLQDIADQLALPENEVKLVRTSLNRANLFYRVVEKSNWKCSIDDLHRILAANPDESAIVYCLERKETEAVAGALCKLGLQSDYYHAGLADDSRADKQNAFMSGQVKIIVATIAFGMGIDKPDIRTVAHWDMPKSIEGYYQETGRAGRDGYPAKCFLFYNSSVAQTYRYFANHISAPEAQRQALYNIRLMQEVCTTSRCRRRLVLRHFGEKSNPASRCGNCDNCKDAASQNLVREDVTEIAQQIMCAILRTGSRFGKAYVIDVLRGSRSKRILDNRHHLLQLHGLAIRYDKAELSRIVQGLEEEGILEKSKDEFPVLKLMVKGRNALENGEQIKILLPSETDQRRRNDDNHTPKSYRAVQNKNIAHDSLGTENRALFEALRSLRLKLAQENNLPPYVVFHDKHLRQMALSQPATESEMLKISGIGNQKWKLYGQQFIGAIDDWKSRRRISQA